MSELSKLEQVFGFEHEAFRRYIHMHASGDASPPQFLQLSGEMEAHDHPLVQYAAGWAAAEAALFRRRPRSNIDQPLYPFEDRKAALESARSLWEGAGVGFRHLDRAAVSSRQAADVWSFKTRSWLSCAYLPSMEIAANWFSGRELNTQDTSALLDRTSEKVIQLGRVVMNTPAKDAEHRSAQKGLIYEMTAGLVLQYDRPFRRLIVPSSIRQDNHKVPRMRSDLVAISTEAGHAKTLIGVTGHRTEEGRSDSSRIRFDISVDPDLLLNPTDRTKSRTDTLMAFINREAGILDPATAQRLDEMSRVLTERLVAM